MRISTIGFMAVLAMTTGTLHAAIAADSARGAELFHTLQCIQCHSINGEGGNLGPDLGRRLNRDFTPASLAATMWNHAPTMWAAMRVRGIQAGELNEQAAADLFAYFYSAGFFEMPGDAGRGKQLFSARHCAECHGLKEAKIPEAKPASQWQSVSQPMMLVDEMWNHAANMRQEFAKRKLKWPDLETQDLTDILVYLRNVTPARIEITSGANGEVLFKSKGCESCHSSMAALSTRLKGQTLTGIAVAMWNHAPKMPSSPPQLDVDEMREIASSLWAEQFFRDAGSVKPGQHVYAAKHCATCHDDPASGAPKLTERVFSGAVLVSALWHHGPRMLDQMRAKKLTWPRFEGPEMANLIAYLNSLHGGK
ncbi:MAG TPA: c-type cytochrome [Bryobacteraceae bacterium]|nr:c-type cytochrome [Bryobacteraceae bacterium]